MMNPEKYCLPADYSIREDVHHFDDTLEKTQEWQTEVYLAAAALTPRSDRWVLDIGCGDGTKLVREFPNHETIGLELDPALSFLKEKYPKRNWQKSNFSRRPIGEPFSTIICSDVIEHLVEPHDPLALLEFINSLDFERLVISTPDRGLLGERSQNGPPMNRAHSMEWNQQEFRELLEKFFIVESLTVSNRAQCTQMAVCSKKNLTLKL